MEGVAEPSKESVREWLHRRRDAGAPPPPIEQIRRELGWERSKAQARGPARKGAPHG
jgi:ribosomal protein S24E